MLVPDFAEPERGARTGLLVPGEVFAGRTVVAVLGRGSSAEVFRVRGPSGPEALKVVDPAVARTPAGRARFRRECEIAATLHHPGVVAVLDHGEAARAGGAPGGVVLLWAATELLEGGTAARLRPVGRSRPDVPVVLDVLAQAAAGLDAVHRADVVHGDVKPSNVLLSAVPGAAVPGAVPLRAALTDFGIARFLDEARPVARHGRVEGSLPYVAPEVLQAQRITPAVDVYSLGCAAVELLSGDPPYPRATGLGTARAHLRGAPPRLSRRRRWLPAALDAVVARALAVDPRRRPPTCAALVAELAVALAGPPPRAPSAG